MVSIHGVNIDKALLTMSLTTTPKYTILSTYAMPCQPPYTPFEMLAPTQTTSASSLHCIQTEMSCSVHLGLEMPSQVEVITS